MSWSGRVILLLLGVVLLLPACGYQLTANAPIDLPKDSTRLFLAKVTNPTTETWLEPMLRSSLRDELTRRGNVTWVGRDEAEATVNIDVRTYSASSAVKGRDDVTVKSVVRIRLEVSFFSANNDTLIWTSGPVLASESYRVAGENRDATRSSGKRDATQKAVELAMRMVADRLSQKF